MHNLCIPGPVAVLVRRVVNVISTLSIAQQYHQGNRVLDKEYSDEFPRCAPESRKYTPLRENLSIQWMWMNKVSSWDIWWLQLAPLEQYERLIQSILIYLPWLGSLWRLTWHKNSVILGSAPAGQEYDEEYPSFDTANDEPTQHGHNSGGRPETNQHGHDDDIIHRLMGNPALYDPMRTPRFPIVLCHGLYGFDVRGPASIPFLQHHYWSNILNILRKKVGAEVIVTSVPSTGSIISRSTKLHAFLQDRAQGRGINFLGHSMGGLDCRHLISHIKPVDYTPLSLTTVGTPHRGSPFMDWCQDNIGLGQMNIKHALDQTSTGNLVNDSASSSRESSPSSKPLLSLSSLPSSFTTLLISVLDSPAYANLTTKYLNEVFNPATPNDPGVKYFSVAGRVDAVSIWHPLWLPKMVLDGAEAREKQLRFPSSHAEDLGWGNDCLVSVQSAKWGEFLGVLEGCDHWEMRGARGLDLNVDFSSVSMPSFARASVKKGGQDGDGWSLKDWGRFAKRWKNEESKAAVSATPPSRLPSEIIEDGDRARENALKSSTDKVSAVLDWIVEQVPPRKDPSAFEREQTKRRDMDTKEGLERLYVALSRKLYDEGL